MNIPERIRFVGDGGLDFQVHQRDNTAIVSANIIQGSPDRRARQFPLILTRVSHDSQGRIVIFTDKDLSGSKITLTFQGIDYPIQAQKTVTSGCSDSDDYQGCIDCCDGILLSCTDQCNDQSCYTDCITDYDNCKNSCIGIPFVTLPGGLDNGVGKLKVEDNTGIYEANVVLSSSISPADCAINASQSGHYIMAYTAPFATVTAYYSNDPNNIIGQTTSDPFGVAQIEGQFITPGESITVTSELRDCSESDELIWQQIS